ncbi:unnamed protein product [Rotaria socialis]|uniref:C2H2-type domain-containing protein n=1 Tax=Rotaria socialis TaxID=392032 RepID=A0A818MAD7_9BILA|nr:unnamed protein product [Rotaria socialis]CAF4643158.1 unnamed protein product [Rotaria socialis]
MGSSESKQSSDTTYYRQSQAFMNVVPYNIDNSQPAPNDIYQRLNHSLYAGPPLTMPIQPTYRCNYCGMVFTSDEALYKHRTRFCVGNPDASIRRNPNNLNNGTNGTTFMSENYSNSQPTLGKITAYPSPIEKKREEITEWKNKRSILQSVQDMEDRILVDSRKTEQVTHDLKKQTHEYNQILSEYEKLQTQERDLLREMYNLHGRSRLYFMQPKDLNDYERNQLEVLNQQNNRIKHEREAIQSKLETLIGKDNPQPILPYYDPYRLLRDMKEQQDHNENNLAYLRRRLMYPNSSNESSFLPRLNLNRQTTTDDVRALRNRYLQSGGHDNDVLSQFNDLEEKLRYYESFPWMKGYPEPLTRYPYHPFRPREPTNDKLTSTVTEKERLENELSDMQRKFQQLDSRTKQLELTLATTGLPNQNSNLNNNNHRYVSPKNDGHQWKSTYTRIANPNYTNSAHQFVDQPQQFHQPSLPIIDTGRRSRGMQPASRIASNSNGRYGQIESKPYDPVGGFVIFFDFIINLSPMIEKCQLITSLHHVQTGLGEPSQLAVLKSELYNDLKFGEQVSTILLSTKQPVPRCPPQQALSIVIEVLTTTKQSPHAPLRTNAWTRIPLFDNRNRLLSGRWKVPLKMLPIQHDASFPVIATLPTFGRAELHYRLVNYQDAAAQANVLFSLNHQDLYFTPPQFQTRPFM